MWQTVLPLEWDIQLGMFTKNVHLNKIIFYLKKKCILILICVWIIQEN